MKRLIFVVALFSLLTVGCTVGGVAGPAEPMANPVLPDLTAQRVLLPRCVRRSGASMVTPAQVERPAKAALRERLVQPARPAPREPRVGPETANVLSFRKGENR